MYDLTKLESFENLRDWLREVRQNSDPDTIVYLVGNQLDLAEEEREVQTEIAEAWSKENNIDGFSEASAKTAENVSDVS